MNFLSIGIDAAKGDGLSLSRLQTSAIEILRGDAGTLILSLTLLAGFVAVTSTLVLLHRSVRRMVALARPPRSRSDRAQGLARLGATPAEIARAVGLSRDAVALVLPIELSRGTNLPNAAHSAVRIGSPHLGQRRLTSVASR